MEQFRDGLALDNARERFAEIEATARADAYALGINATPTVVVNGVPLESPDFQTVADAIDIELAKAATVAAADPAADVASAEEADGDDEGPAGDE